MKIISKNPGCAVLACSSLLMLAGCDGLSDVGDQANDKTPPDAVVTVIGQPSTIAGGKVTVRARSGSEILMSGKDSIETVLPILTFDWQPRNASAEQLKIVNRNNSTIAFQVPSVAESTNLELRLVVTDSDGRSDTQDIDVLVDPVSDPDQFLTYLGAPTEFTVVAVSSAALPPCAAPGQANCLAADVPFVIDIETRASYWDIGGQFNEADDSVVVDSRSFSDTWLSALGASPHCNALENPAFTVPIPTFDADEIAAAVQSGAPTRVVDASRIDEAVLRVTARISQPAGALGLPAGELQLCVPEFSNSQVVIAQGKSRLPVQLAPDGAAMQVDFTTDELLSVLVPDTDPDAGGAAVQDTRQSATAYYATIDEQADAAQKQTFVGWLKVNGFLPSSHGPVIDWAAVAAGSDAQAMYVNNFDLGFGRDMYARRLRCSHAGPDFQPGDCDIASVVVNYGSLEAAAKKLGPQLAVAMEYSRKGSSGPRFVKFYTYAPDVQCDPGNSTAGACSQFERVLSANLDGRGEKFMPGACTICHGGAPLGLDSTDATRYAAGGDVNAAFLPWDLESLLFSDNPEAGFPDNERDFAHHQLWLDSRKSAQTDRIKSLNQLAALTYVDPEGQLNRYELLRQLVNGWYAGSGGAFDEDFVPPQWDADADHRSLYLNVFAQYCRACHVAHIPNRAGPGIAGVDPFEKCGPEDAGSAYLGNDHQIAFGCRQQFVNTRSLAARVAEGLMPAARLTMDRFWVSPNKSAAEFLSEHLDAPLASLAPQSRPVLDLASIAQTHGTDPTPGSFDPVSGNLEISDRSSIVRLLGSIQGASGPFSWSVLSPDGAVVALSGAGGLTPAFAAHNAGVYPIAFSAGATTLNRTLTIPNWLPGARSDSATAAPLQRITVDIVSNDKALREDQDPAIESDLAEGDGPHVVELCSSNDQCGRAAVVTVNGGTFEFESPTTDVVAYTPGPDFTGSDQVSYRLTDIDLERSTASLTVEVQQQLVANLRCARIRSTQALDNIVLPITGGVPPYQITFDPVLPGLAAVPGSANTYSFQAPALNANTTPQIFTGALDTTYTAVDSAGAAEQAGSNSLQLRIFAQEPWSRTAGGGIRELLDAVQSTAVNGSVCSDCHTAPPLTLTGDSEEDYSALNGVTSLAAPADSLLLRCPTGGGLGCPSNTAHLQFFAIGDPTYQRLLLWIQEGSTMNSSADPAYNCP